MAQPGPGLKKYDSNIKNVFALLGKIMSCVPIRRVPGTVLTAPYTLSRGYLISASQNLLIWSLSYNTWVAQIGVE